MLLLLIATIVIVGCGQKDDVEPEDSVSHEIPINQRETLPDPVPYVEEPTGSEPEGIVEGGIMPYVHDFGDGTLEYKLVNHTGNKVMFEFTSGQRIDYSVTKKDGQELYLHSSVSSFMQALGEEMLQPGDELVYNIDVTDLHLDKGEYLLEVWFTSTANQDYRIVMDYNVN